MRRFFTFLTVVFLILTFSCNKDALEDTSFNDPEAKPALKEQLAIPLVAAQTMSLGTVDVTNNATHLMVNIAIGGAYPNLVLYETHLYLGTSAPARQSPGKFPYQHYVNLAADSYTVPLAELGAETGDIVHIAVHCEIVEWYYDATQGQWVWIFEETAWMLDEGLPGWAYFRNGWGGYFEYSVI